MRVRFDPVSICQKLELLHIHACLRRNMTCHIRMQPALRTKLVQLWEFLIATTQRQSRERPPPTRGLCDVSDASKVLSAWRMAAACFHCLGDGFADRFATSVTSGSGPGAGSCFWHGWAFIRTRLPSHLVAGQPRACRLSRGDRASAASYTRQACRFWGYCHQNSWGNGWIPRQPTPLAAWLSLAPPQSDLRGCRSVFQSCFPVC